MLDGWAKRGPNECAALYRAPVRILVEWYQHLSGLEVTLYEDGHIECEGAVPVELLPHVWAEWHYHLRGKVA